MTTSLVHFFNRHTCNSRTACGLGWAELFGVGRISRDIVEVTCKACLATDEGAAALMENALVHPEKSNAKAYLDLVKKQQDEVLDKYRARYSRWIIPPHHVKATP